MPAFLFSLNEDDRLRSLGELMKFFLKLTGHGCVRSLCLSLILFADRHSLLAQDKNPNDVPQSEIHHAGGVAVVIRPPWQGMVELGADRRIFMDQFVPPYNQLIAGFVNADDASKVGPGVVKAPPQIAMMAVSRQYESTDIKEDGFKMIVDNVAKQFESTAESYAKENEEEFNRRMKALDLDNIKITMEKPVSLGCLFSTPNSVGFGTILQVSATNSEEKPAKGHSVQKALSVLFVRVRNRVLFGYIFADYEGPDTVKWLRKVSSDWSNAILTANQ
jgi:hypothetical protein